MALSRVTPAGGRIQLAAYTERVQTIAPATGSVSLDGTLANLFDLTLTGNVTLSVANVPAAGSALSLVLVLRQDATGARAITWPANTRWPNAVVPSMSTGAGKVDVATLTTLDGGASWLAAVSANDLR